MQTGLMAWLSVDGSDGEKVLHLKIGAGDWAPYWEYPFARHLELKRAIASANADFDLSTKINRPVSALQLSKGWATYQALLKQGWSIVPSHAARAVA